MSFRPDRVEKKFSLVPETKASPFLVAFQLLAIAVGLRLVMLISGVAFMRVPLLDDALIPLARWILRVANG